MKLGSALECVAAFPLPEDFEHFAQDVAPEWIVEALAATGTATMRRRRLPVEQVPWLVIGMALFRDRPIAEVVNKLDLALPSPVSPTVAPSAISATSENRSSSSLFLRDGRNGATRVP
jgi:hypothetical protein